MNISLHSFKKEYAFLSFILLFIGHLNAQSLSKTAIKKAAKESLLPSIETYKEFLAIPNIGSYKKHRNDNVDWCVQTFDALNFKTQILTSDGIPHVLAERTIDPNYKTILFYLQIDGQPVDSTKWNQPHPFKPVLKAKKDGQWEIIDWSNLATNYDPDYRVFARSSSDSKGPAMAFITALQILKEKRIEPTFNLRVIMDFQEELGSPTLPKLVEEKRDLFAAEMMLIMDGTRHLSNLPTLTFGCRGLATVTLKVFGAKRALHSGQYGNFSPNPALKMAQLLGGMKDKNGWVTIPHFYDGVYLSEEEKKSINDLPENLEDIKKSLGIAEIDNVGATYQEALQYPSLNIRGLQSAWVGKEKRTIVPAEAIAEIDMRLVPETPGERQVQLLKKYIENQGFQILDSLPTDAERQQYPNLIQMEHRIGSKPFRTDMNGPLGKWLGEAMQHVYGSNYIKMRTTGGSQPIAPFITTLGIPAVSIRIPNPDNSIHAPNENFRIGNYLEGIETCLSILVKELK